MYGLDEIKEMNRLAEKANKKIAKIKAKYQAKIDKMQSPDVLFRKQDFYDKVK